MVLSVSMFFAVVFLADVASSANLLTAIKCKTPICETPPHGCQSYTVNDERGCPNGCHYSCGAPWCTARTCVEQCVGGYKKDQAGCNTCICKPECVARLCRNECTYGYALNEDGCQTCNCKRRPKICHLWMKCSQGFCPGACQCQPNCGFVNLSPDNPSPTL